MSTWTERIKDRMRHLNMTQEELANKLSLTRGAITHYLAGRRVPPLRQFQKLAAVLKTDPAWLQFGDTSQLDTELTPSKKTSTKHPLPLLTWEYIAKHAGASKSLKIDKTVPHVYTNHLHWYALQVKGDAMTAPLGQQKSFYEGSIIIIDPDKEAKHGDFVVAIPPRSKEATFKQYVEDGNARYLKPLNPQYPITQISKGAYICGVVVGCLNWLS